MTLLLIVGAAWVAAAAPLAVLIGRLIGFADRGPEKGVVAPDYVPAHWVTSAAESR